MKLTKDEKTLVSEVRKAVKYEDRGCPAKDVIDKQEMIKAMRLLLRVLKPTPKAFPPKSI